MADMSVATSFVEWCRSGRLSAHWREISTSGRSLTMMRGVFPAGDLSSGVTSDLILAQDLGSSGMRVRADIGGGRFESRSRPGAFYLVAPDYANSIEVTAAANVRDLAFDTRAWSDLLDDAGKSPLSFDFGRLHAEMFTSATLQSKVRRFAELLREEGGMSLLLAQAAGCEILAELHRLAGSRLAPTRGGLSPSATRRCVDLMHARMTEDLGISDLASEAGLSPFHFSRMFKLSVGLSPREYLIKVRLEKARELLLSSELSVLEIAHEVGYSSGPVLARAFANAFGVNPTNYRKTPSSLLTTSTMRQEVNQAQSVSSP